MQVRRGDIVVVNLNPTKGREQRGADRPCVVIQNDVGNQYSPLTMTARDTPAPLAATGRPPALAGRRELCD